VETEVLEQIAVKSEGGLRDAESLLGQLLSLGLKKIALSDAQTILPSAYYEDALNFAEQLIAGDQTAALQTLSTTVESGVNLDNFALNLTELLRSILLNKISGSLPNSYNYSDQIIKRIKKLSTATAPEYLLPLIDRALKRKLEIKTAPIPQLPLELLVIESALYPARASAAANPTVADAQTKPTVEPTSAAPKPSLVETVKHTIAHLTHDEPLKTTLEQIQNRWDEVIAKLDAANHSLAFILKMCTLQKLAGRHLCLTVPFSLHQEKLAENKTKKILEPVLEQTFSEKILFTCAVAAKAAADTDIALLAASFGGEVMN